MGIESGEQKEACDAEHQTKASEPSSQLCHSLMGLSASAGLGSLSTKLRLKRIAKALPAPVERGYR